MTNFIQFTIRNLDLRIKRATGAMEANQISMEFAMRDGDKNRYNECSLRIEKLANNIDGYIRAIKKLEQNKTIRPDDAEYILKSLNIRKKKLNENMAMCQNAIRVETKALETKEDTVVSVGGGFSASIQHYDDVSISIITDSKERIEKIGKSLDHCNHALKFFEGYLV